MREDDPAGAREEIREAIAGWSNRAFYMQHYYALVAEADVALYLGEPQEAVRLLRERTPALLASRLLRIHHLRIEWLHLRARSRLAMAVQTSGGEAEASRASALEDARRIEAEGVGWASALASLIRAGVSSIQGDDDETLDRLADAERGFEAADMALYAALARIRQGQILGSPSGAHRSAPAFEWMRGQGIRSEEGIAATFAPGRWKKEVGAK